MAILIVDDSDDFLALMALLIRQAGYSDLLTARSAEEALALLNIAGYQSKGLMQCGSGPSPGADGNGKEIDLILMDIVMPGLNGIEACRIIRDCESCNDIPIIIYSATRDVRSIEDAFDAGATDFVSKPVDNIIEISARIHSALRLRGEILKRRRFQGRAESLGDILERALNEIYVFDAETLGFVHVNRGARKNLGYSMDELKNLTPIDLKPEITPECLDRLLSPLRTGEEKEVEVRTIQKRKDGSSYPVEVRLHASEFESRPVFVAVTLDVSDRKEAENELKESRERYKVAMHMTNDGWWDRNIKTGEVHYSHRWKEMLGYEDDEIARDFREWTDRIHPDDFERVMQDLEEYRAGRTKYYMSEYRLRHKDGSYLWVRAKGANITDKNGEETHFAGSHVDITERKKLQLELEKKLDIISQSQKEWQETFDSIMNPIFIHDSEYRIMKANRAYAETAGLEFDDIMGRPYNEIFPKMEAPLELAWSEDDLRKGIEMEVELPTGNLTKTFGKRIYSVRDFAGSHIYSIHIMEDITEEKKGQQMLIQSAKLASIGELAANVAHEINNPMTAVLAYSSIMLEEMEAGTEFHRQVEVIERESLRVRDIVKNLLNFSRHREIVRKKSDLNEVVKECLSLISNMTRTSNIRIDTEYGENIPLIEIDPNQMKQVFINIINNACHAMEKGGLLFIKTEEVDKNVVASFRDSGGGIPKEALMAIFEPFFSTKGERGTGLGLSVSYGIVKNHGGDIVVVSEEGAGSEFRVSLPV